MVCAICGVGASRCRFLFGDCQSNKLNDTSNNRAVTSKVLPPERARFEKQTKTARAAKQTEFEDEGESFSRARTAVPYPRHRIPLRFWLACCSLWPSETLLCPYLEAKGTARVSLPREGFHWLALERSHCQAIWRFQAYFGVSSYCWCLGGLRNANERPKADASICQ